MSHYKDIRIEVNTGKHSIADVIKAMGEILADEVNASAVAEQYQNKLHETHMNIYIMWGYAIRWDDEDDEKVMKLSKLLPDAEFIIYGKGRRRNDVWEEKYKNGECKRRY